MREREAKRLEKEREINREREMEMERGSKGEGGWRWEPGCAPRRERERGRRQGYFGKAYGISGNLCKKSTSKNEAWQWNGGVHGLWKTYL
ncbi:hypothetical protein CKAN_01762900 [Cinnamomum micranthum f. kanehirae]|uniref:Uncharacterized protein n=1 Tax=Cinnamomum micranthum f. kanehirae TaxID=337451 RepID=A0A3S3MRX3_9MAGN|nr:hypothetical protein CKAN_01762900 [Cinnamomum micranthum f. kanehirae]